ncbi:MAG: hypothetical protein B7Z73_07865 [Planctomycetia bacterium 21-64-5]|nr:MAG: hypothetical protein B7Z73_07865 [Planctomycetia bacterium 21-64-5]HQU45198.1 hypothetical protein [Pirellulales bacterium]
MTHLATEAGSSRADPQQARPPSKPAAKSPLTVRLPDLNAGRATARIDAAAADGTGRLVSMAAVPETALQPTSVGSQAASPTSGERSATKLSSFAKVIAFVRQPKFWLACLVFAAVQVVLALVVTPGEEDYGQAERVEAAAKKWSAPESAPAARIVVPAAPNPAEAIEPGGGVTDGTTTPMGLAAPIEPSVDAQGADGDALTEAASAVSASPPTRMAENRRRAADRGQFDGKPVREPDGATLGGIVPLGPNPETNSNEQP